jgi:hypothetical protein
MCDFHSIVVRRDGAIAHIPQNSHSGAVGAAGWRENDQMADMRGAFFVEAEWGGVGRFPGVEEITYSFGGGSLAEKQAKVIEAHYENLSKLLADPAAHAGRMLFDGGYFSGDEYADVRWRVLHLPNTPWRIVERLVKSKLHADAQMPIRSLHPAITKIDGSFAVAEGVTLETKTLAEVSGGVYMREGSTLTAPVLAEVSGGVYMREGSTLTVPALVKVSGGVYVRENATLTAPALAEVSGDVYKHRTAKMDAPLLNGKGGGK